MKILNSFLGSVYFWGHNEWEKEADCFAQLSPRQLACYDARELKQQRRSTLMSGKIDFP